MHGNKYYSESVFNGVETRERTGSWLVIPQANMFSLRNFIEHIYDGQLRFYPKPMNFLSASSSVG